MDSVLQSTKNKGVVGTPMFIEPLVFNSRLVYIFLGVGENSADKLPDKYM